MKDQKAEHLATSSYLYDILRLSPQSALSSFLLWPYIPLSS